MCMDTYLNWEVLSLKLKDRQSVCKLHKKLIYMEGSFTDGVLSATAALISRTGAAT